MKFVLVIICISIYIFTVDSSSIRRSKRQASCSSSSSNCISLRECSVLLNLLRNPSNRREALRTLNQAMCAFDRRNPKVCCPSSSTIVEPPINPPRANGNLLPINCGHSVIGDKIVNGEDVALGAYPWAALLGYNRFGRTGWDCGGALINKRYILTAAHCTVRKHTFHIRDGVDVVRLGEHNLATNTDCVQNVCADPVQDYTVEEVIRHESFEQRSEAVSDDIALLRLNRDVDLTPWIQPVCLPSNAQDVITRVRGSDKIIVTGWGATNVSRQSDIMQQASIPFVEKDVCQRSWNPHTLLPEQICFGGEGGRDSCSGDSGGPVLHPKSNNTPQYEMIGIVSFGRKECGESNIPAIYTNVAAYRDWILRNLKA